MRYNNTAGKTRRSSLPGSSLPVQRKETTTGTQDGVYADNSYDECAVDSEDDQCAQVLMNMSANSTPRPVIEENPSSSRGANPNPITHWGERDRDSPENPAMYFEFIHALMTSGGKPDHKEKTESSIEEDNGKNCCPLLEAVDVKNEVVKTEVLLAATQVVKTEVFL